MDNTRHGLMLKQEFPHVIQNINPSVKGLNSDLMEISDWAFPWNVRFNPDPKISRGDFQ